MRSTNLIPVPPISNSLNGHCFTCKRSESASWFYFSPSFPLLFLPAATSYTLLLIHSVRASCGANKPVWTGYGCSRRSMPFVVLLTRAHFLAHVVLWWCNLLHFCYLKGCWTNSEDASRLWRLSKLPDAATLLLVFTEGWSSVSAKLWHDERETPWSLMAFYCIFNLKVSANTKPGSWEIAPVTKFTGSTEKCYRSHRTVSKDLFMQSFIGHRYPLTSSYKLSKACWCWGFSGFSWSSRFIWPCHNS